MGYLENSMADNENLIEKFNLSKYSFFNIYMLFGFATTFLVGAILIGVMGITLGMIDNTETVGKVLLGLGLFIFLYAAYGLIKLRSVEMAVTNRRIVYKRGIIAVNTEEIRLEAVETVEVKQTMSDRLMGMGSVYITGRGTSTISFISIDDPVDVKKLIGSSLNSSYDGRNSN